MSKLFKLREWLTLDEAARHLSVVVSEQVTPSDILRLCLDGHLVLSVNFVNHSQAKRGKVVGVEDAEWQEFPPGMTKLFPGLPESEDDKPIRYMRSLNLDDERFLTLESEVQKIEGVWDLPLIGSERLDIEHKFQLLTGGPAVTLTCLDGAFVQQNASEMWQLMESFDDNEFHRGSNAAKKKLELRIALQELSEEEAQRLMMQHAEDRKKFLADRKSWLDPDSYYPAGALPDDAVLVVRTAALREFEQSLQGAPGGERLGRREETTYLNIIGGLLHLLLGKSPGSGKKYSSFASQDAVISGLLAHFDGAPGISKRTLESKFAEAKRSIDAC
ncbi:hypothetical protein PPMP20_17890 [Paraburkholderia phymatum]|uniref:hypothetical protein n=1 Tax=Paraburkholderia phymatum TaxID=148447 RepID=UPI0000E7CCD5|nr:hypothetical protein [Paraburkholderia phymatum]